MAGNCKNINPLIHSGTSQLQRVLKALDPASAPLDGRTAADLILFAKEYAKYLQYYNFQNVTDGNWQPFMQMDIAVILATLLKENMSLYEAYRRGLNTEILSSTSESLSKKLLEALFDVLFTYVYHLDEQSGLLPDAADENVFIQNIITGKLKDAYQKILAYYQEAKTADLLDESSLFIPPTLFPPTTIQAAKVLLQQKLSANWTSTTTATVTALKGSDKNSKIKNLVTHNLFNAAVDTLLKSIGTLSGFAANALDKSLTDNPTHSPHYALYLTFIRLFKYAQNHLNTFTATHLQFYYKQILQLKIKPAVSDVVRLTVELQKNTDALLIPANTVFKAGKDADGKEIFYATKQDFIVNQIKVKALQNILKVSYAALGGYQNIYKSNIANSDDGAGATLTNSDKSWATFGNEKKVKNLADIGFAIASPQFYLQEGKRVITINYTFQQTVALSNAVLQQAFKVKLTGEKGWINVDAASIKANAYANNLSFTLTLDPKIPAIVGYSPKIHQGQFNTFLPMLQFVLNMQRNTYNPLQVLSQLKVNNVQVSATVEGLKKLTVSTDTGAVDPAKPFMPFGPSPHLGSAFILGVKEAFQKPLTDLKVLVEWDKLPVEGLDLFEKTNYPYTDTSGNLRYRKHLVNMAHLESGIWVDEAETRGLFTADELFHSNLRTDWTKRSSTKYAKTTSEFSAETWENSYDFIPCPISKFITADVEVDQTEQKFSLSSRNGFMKLELTGNDFGHDEYLDKILNPTITSTTSGSTITQTSNRPKPPYTPVIKSIEVNYTSSSQLNFSADASFSTFFYLTPFGFQQQTTGGFSLLPNFQNEGEFYIGLDGTKVPQSVSILFQISEGSANPLKDKEPVTWAYLSAPNIWVDLDKHQFEDRTNGLLVSGLINFQLPADLAINANLMGENLAWLKASVVKNTDAICRIIDVLPQGIEASFTDINLSGNQFKAHVPAGSISKLVISNPLIKKITQPFDSVGGATEEDDQAFEVRISERLRHKQRATAIWDYERLVLQQFPDIYKVKCLNHTGISGNDWNEMYPGHVAVITIPNLKNRNTVDPLMPYTSLGKLQEIQNYLQTVVSPFVQLQVVNPQLEQVQFDFEVRFFEQYDVGVYSKILDDSIEQFLSPWAFDFGKDIEFGGKISKSVVLKFIEDQYYVDYVSCFRMNHWIDAASNRVLKNVEEAIATTSRSILVSYHDLDTGIRHLIQTILTETSICDCV